MSKVKHCSNTFDCGFGYLCCDNICKSSCLGGSLGDHCTSSSSCSGLLKCCSNKCNLSTRCNDHSSVGTLSVGIIVVIAVFAFIMAALCTVALVYTYKYIKRNPSALWAPAPATTTTATATTTTATNVEGRRHPLPKRMPRYPSSRGYTPLPHHYPEQPPMTSQPYPNNHLGPHINYPSPYPPNDLRHLRVNHDYSNFSPDTVPLSHDYPQNLIPTTSAQPYFTENMNPDICFSSAYPPTHLCNDETNPDFHPSFASDTESLPRDYPEEVSISSTYPHHNQPINLNIYVSSDHSPGHLRNIDSNHDHHSSSSSDTEPSLHDEEINPDSPRFSSDEEERAFSIKATINY